MGIWIRSQDKEILTNVIAVGVDIGSNIYAITNNDKLEPLVIGNYSTKEKALLVLDMIEEYIESNNSSHNSQWDSTPYRVYNVFQMPDDESL